MRKPPRLCRVCDAPTKRPSKPYCCLACYNKDRQSVAKGQLARDCERCGTTFKSWEKTQRFCSVKCGALSRIAPKRPCPVCAGPILRKRNTYCSAACYAKAACQVPYSCEVCGGPRKKVYKCCSVKCSRILYEKTARPTDQIAKLRELRTSGMGFAEILTHVSLKVSPRGLEKICREYEIYAPKRQTLPRRICKTCGAHTNERSYCSAACRERAEIRARDRRSVVITRSWRRIAAPLRAAPPPGIPAKSSPIHLELREVYQWGAYLRENHGYTGDCGDIHAVSRAMKKADPDHPGFALKMRRSLWACENSRKLGEAA